MTVRQITDTDWRAFAETRHLAVAAKMAEPVLNQIQMINAECWSTKSNWRLGFYFGSKDTRLWVPTRSKRGTESSARRVINFGHPLGRSAFKTLMLAYGSTALFTLALLAIAAGIRW